MSRTRARTAYPKTIERLRADAPALRQRMKGRQLIYLDAAATTQRPQAVLDAMSDYYARDNGNSHQKGHELGKKSKQVSDQARKTVADFIGAEAKEEIVWVQGTTEAINVVARTWVEENVKQGDNIVLTT